MPYPAPSTPVTLKSRSGIVPSGVGYCRFGARRRFVRLAGSSVHDDRVFFQPGKESIDFIPYLLAAGETAPVYPNQAHQFEADVHWRQEIFARLFHAIDEQRFDIVRHSA